MMNGKEVFHNLYQRYSNIQDFEIEILSKEDSKQNNNNIPAYNNAEANQSFNQNPGPKREINQIFTGVEGEITFEEMTEKLKKLYQLEDNEGSIEVKEKELILFDEIANQEQLQLNSFDEFNSLEKLNSIQCSDENFIVNS